MALHEPSRHSNPGDVLNLPNLAGVGIVSVYATGESQARVGMAALSGLAHPLHRPPLAPRDAVLEGLVDNARRVTCCLLTQEARV